jgi:hypothetical protein
MSHNVRLFSFAVNCPNLVQWSAKRRTDARAWRAEASRLTRHVKNGIGVFGPLLQYLDCFDSRQNKQFDFVTLGFAPYFLHHWQSPVCTTANDELVALPGDLLFCREGRVTELLSEFLGGFFLALTDFAAINDDIVLVGAAVDLDGAEREVVETYRRTP